MGIEAEIVVDPHGMLLLNGPRVMPDGSGNIWLWTMLVEGVTLTAAFVLPLGEEADGEMFKEVEKTTREDLLYMKSFITVGCPEKNLPHTFHGDVHDHSTLLVCSVCGMLKRPGMALPRQLAPFVKVVSLWPSEPVLPSSHDASSPPERAGKRTSSHPGGGSGDDPQD